MAENQHTKAQTLLKFTKRITKELMDSVIQKSSWASCEFNTHRRRRRDADATQLDSWVASASVVCIGHYGTLLRPQPT